MTSSLRRAGSGLLAAGVCLTVLGSASTASAAVAPTSATASAATSIGTSVSTDWFTDPLSRLERRQLARVPERPGVGDRKRAVGTRTKALHRTASGDLAVPASVVRGHQLTVGQAVVAPVRFAGRSADLDTRSRTRLDRLRAATELVGELRCEGHNDYRRNAPTSAGARLAKARAAAVCRYLDGGRAEVRTSAFSAGSAHPVVIGPHRARGFNPRSRNRRVIVTVTADAISVVSAPGAVELLGAVPGDGQATLTFSAPAEDGGAPVTGYEVSTDAGATWSALTYTGTGPYTAVLADLVNATAYSVLVRAVNSAGPGAASGTMSVTPVSAVVPASAPLVFGAHTDFGTDVHFQLQAPPSDGGSPITGYEYAYDNGDWTAIAEGEMRDSGGGAFDVRVYPPGMDACPGPQDPRTFQVRAMSAAGAGAASEPVLVDEFCF